MCRRKEDWHARHARHLSPATQRGLMEARPIVEHAGQSSPPISSSMVD